jgi:hypothetical protein
MTHEPRADNADADSLNTSLGAAEARSREGQLMHVRRARFCKSITQLSAAESAEPPPDRSFSQETPELAAIARGHGLVLALPLTVHHNLRWAIRT